MDVSKTKIRLNTFISVTSNSEWRKYYIGGVAGVQVQPAAGGAALQRGVCPHTATCNLQLMEEHLTEYCNLNSSRLRSRPS